jgi:hypothetical protein
MDLTNQLVAKPDPINRSVRCPVATTAAAHFSVAAHH